jgi:hypothetical protein
MQDGTKYLVLTREEAELLLDSFRVSHPLTRALALKIAGLILEWAARDDVVQVERILRAAKRLPPGE